MSDPDQEVFHRLELAARLVADLLEPPAASPVRSGLFLAAPRRTGKSTFLIAALVPESYPHSHQHGHTPSNSPNSSSGEQKRP